MLARVVRLELGLFGDYMPFDAGVWELRVDGGPGYRVYYAQTGRRVILLLIGGDKRSQSADIRKAIRLWEDWQWRYHEKT